MPAARRAGRYAALQLAVPRASVHHAAQSMHSAQSRGPKINFTVPRKSKNCTVGVPNGSMAALRAGYVGKCLPGGCFQTTRCAAFHPRGGDSRALAWGGIAIASKSKGVHIDITQPMAQNQANPLRIPSRLYQSHISTSDQSSTPFALRPCKVACAEPPVAVVVICASTTVRSLGPLFGSIQNTCAPTHEQPFRGLSNSGCSADST
jgi:hypothetical protein